MAADRAAGPPPTINTCHIVSTPVFVEKEFYMLVLQLIFQRGTRTSKVATDEEDPSESGTPP
jgi:hypothetical protein